MIVDYTKDKLIKEYQRLRVRQDELNTISEDIREESGEIYNRMYEIHDILKNDLKNQLEGEQDGTKENIA